MLPRYRMASLARRGLRTWGLGPARSTIHAPAYGATRYVIVRLPAIVLRYMFLCLDLEKHSVLIAGLMFSSTLGMNTRSVRIAERTHS